MKCDVFVFAPASGEKEMLRMPFLVACLILLAAAPCHGELVAYWDFNGFDPASDTSLAADTGSGTIDLTQWQGGVANFAGTTTNVLGDSAAGSSLILQGGAETAGNGTFIEIETPLIGLQDPVITFATRGTNTGFDLGIWSWSTDGISYANLEGVNTASRATSFSLATADFSGVSGLTDASSAFFRYTLDGATSPSGNNRIDNLQINASASAVPEPACIAMLTLIGGVGAIWRWYAAALRQQAGMASS